MNRGEDGDYVLSESGAFMEQVTTYNGCHICVYMYP